MSNKVQNKKTKFIAVCTLILIAIVIIILLLLKNIKYEVTFDSNGGTEIDLVNVLKNENVTKPEDPTRENYEFAGWYYNDQPFDFSKPITKDITLEARWNLKDTGSIETGEKSLSLKLGASKKINITSLPEGVELDSLIYTSDKSNIVSVDNEGNIKALKVGTAIITISTKDGKKAIIEVVVTEDKIPVEKISLNKTKLSLTVNETTKLKATIKPNNATNKKVTWKSSNTGVVSVDSSGKITAKNSGTATITVTTKDGNYSATCIITVVKKDAPVSSSVAVKGVALNKSKLEITEGNSETLKATINPSNATNKNVAWESSNSNVVSVDANGKITAKNPGTATITVITKDGNFKATCIVVVSEKEPSYIIKISKVAMEVGSTTFQHKISVTKDGNTFNDYLGIIYNGKRQPKGEHLGDSERNTAISSATLVLNDGKEIKNVTVVYQ